MEFSIDIHNSLQGDITLEDFSKEYGYYIPEGNDYPDSRIEEIDGVSTLKYKYSKTVTLNTILKVNMEEAILQDVLIHKHEDDVDVCSFHVEEDGYYVVNHYVLPTREWYDNFLKNPDTELSEFISVFFQVYGNSASGCTKFSPHEILSLSLTSLRFLYVVCA